MYRTIKNTCLLLILISSIITAEDWSKLLNLRGRWKFAIGDDAEWSSPSYKDYDWEDIRVPSAWEEEGFNGYDGYAWYRRHFKCPENFKGKNIYLHLGFIDDIDQVFVNGKMIGFSGTFPPHYQTAYNAYRAYPVPSYLFKYNADNVIAVRVYDSQLGGGIVSGNIGFYELENSLVADVNLDGLWKFKTGNKEDWKEKNYSDKNWDEIMVPSHWENQGYKDYNGFAWYRKEFNLQDNAKNDKFVLILGKIDDIDEAYINGKLVGATGEMKDDADEISFDQEYAAFRGYFIPQGILQSGKNVVAVKVYDGYNVGGIYEGPVGLITQEKYKNYWKNIRKKPTKDFWDRLFGNGY